MERKVKHSYDFKLRCVEEVLKGRSAISVAAEFKCDRSQLWKWVVLYRRRG
ncbi:helix-turn-helix domain-containing protein, partial [Flavobacterium caeni]